jgi:hypothetical protein
MEYDNDTIKSYQIIYKQNGNTLSTTNLSETRAVDNATASGWDLPNYHERMRRGELLPMTEWSKFSTIGSCNSQYYVKKTTATDVYEWISSDNQRAFIGWVTSPGDLYTHAPELDYYYAQAAAAKIMGNSHDTLTFIAELADVKRMFASTIKNLLKMKPPTNWGRTLSENWLQYRYGWRTLVYDLQSLHDACKNLNLERTRYSEKSGARTTSSWTDVNYEYGSTGTVEITKTTELELGVRGCVVADITLPTFSFNPVVTAWELVPYSFIIDWLISVGKALSAASFLSTAQDYSASIGYIVKHTYHFQRSWIDKAANYSGTVEQSSVVQSELRYRRPCNIPIFPRLKLRLDIAKIFDLTALLMQQKLRR